MLVLFSLVAGCAATGSKSPCAPAELTARRDAFYVSFQHYRPESPRSAVIILPPTGGTTFLDRRYADLFCEHQMAVYLVTDWQGRDEQSYELNIHNRLLGRGQRAIELLLSRIDAMSVSIMGTSVGGIHAATAAARLEEIDRAVIIAAGAPVSSVIAWSEQSDLAAAREVRLRRLGFPDTAAYAAALDATIQWDPFRFRNRSSVPHVAMVMVEDDRVVATRFQRQLLSRWPEAKTWTVSGGHAAGIFTAWLLHAEDILEFLLEPAPAMGRQDDGSSGPPRSSSASSRVNSGPHSLHRSIRPLFNQY